MKLDSKYFDSIRIKPDTERVVEADVPSCEWKGCRALGLHRAPRGRGREGQFHHFCLEHVRRFNAAYNYFQGMPDIEIEAFRKEAVTGHRPTWRLGDNAGKAERQPRFDGRRYARFARRGTHDPHRIFEGEADGPNGSGSQPQRALRPLERRALDALGLQEAAGRTAIKRRFKELVKRHHPDANGGDRGSEDKLREIIQAYNYLKQAGLV